MSERDHTAAASATEPANDQELTTLEAAKIVGLSPAVLKDYRYRDRYLSPPFQKQGRKVTYRLSELLEWMDGRAGP